MLHALTILAGIVCNVNPAHDTSLPAINLDKMVISASRVLDTSREQIVPSLGATKHTLSRNEIDLQSQGDNASFDQTLFRFPGVAQDELDKRLHVRGEEANLQYRINDILIPDGLLGFGQELSPRFIDQLSLIVGTLPAQYGGRTAGIVDLKTKNGVNFNGMNISIYGGSYSTINPSFEYGTSAGKLTFYLNGNFLYNNIGMANPANSVTPLHDKSMPFKGFSDLSYVLDETSRFTLMLSGSHGDFQLPNISGNEVNYRYDSLNSFESSKLNENQSEQSYYEILSYQKRAGALSFQVDQFFRYGDVLYKPDEIGDLMFNGVAAKAEHSLVTNGISGDAGYLFSDRNTLRFGLNFSYENASVNTSNLVFPAKWNDSEWVQTSTKPFEIIDNNSKRAFAYSCYLQDEWKIVDQLTVNYGLRFDGLNAYLNEYQLSPRINAVYQPVKQTSIHIGYARYFTPPPLEFVPSTSISKFDSTTFAANPDNRESSPVKSERYHYFDLGFTQDLFSGFQVALDGYYKIKKYVLDEGQFGPAMIFSPNNADHGFVRGIELTLNYKKNGLSTYGNIAFARAMAYGLISGQFQFDPDELAYMQTHWYHLDHDQDITASAGIAYEWKCGTKAYTDVLYGSGLYGGQYNTQELPQYATVNAGVEQTIKLSKYKLNARFDIVNLFDKVYEIRDGDGIGVFAPQYLPRRACYAGLSFNF